MPKIDRLVALLQAHPRTYGAHITGAVLAVPEWRYVRQERWMKSPARS